MTVTVVSMRTSPNKPDNALKPGDDCGPYEIISTLGRGGYGTVYKAVHHDTGEQVALKVVLHRHAEDERAAERLILEAKAVRRVSHINVVGYRASDRLPDGEGSWLALELVHGQTLGHILRNKRRLPLRTALHLGVQLCAGLAKIHEVPLVHRDIKPYNLMITKAGTLKIIDLGIVRTKRGAGTTRQVGSGYYSAPDYLRLSAEELEGTIDPRWDLYSAGLVLWEALAGHHPLRPKGEDLSLGAILAHYIKDRCLPRLSLPNLPERVADVVAKAVAFDPDERWQSAAELGAALLQQMQRPPVPRRTEAGELPPVSTPSGTDPLSAQELALFQQAEIKAEIAFETARTKPLRLPRRQTRTVPIDHSGDEQTDPVITAPLGSPIKALRDTAPTAITTDEQTDPVITAPLGSAIKTTPDTAPTARLKRVRGGRYAAGTAPNDRARATPAAARPAAPFPIAVDVAPGPPSIGPVPRRAPTSRKPRTLPGIISPPAVEVPTPPSARAPAPSGIGPAASDIEPAPSNIEPVPSNIEPVPSNVDPAPSGIKPAPSGRRPAPSGIEPAPADIAPPPSSRAPASATTPQSASTTTPPASTRNPRSSTTNPAPPGMVSPPSTEVPAPPSTRNPAPAAIPQSPPAAAAPIVMAVKPRPAPIEAQRIIVQALQGAPNQAASPLLPQPTQAAALQPPAEASASTEPTPFLRRQLPQRQFDVALTALILTGGITLLLIVLRLLGVI